MKKNPLLKRSIVIILSVMMVILSMPTTAFAEGEPGQSDVDYSQVQLIEETQGNSDSTDTSDQMGMTIDLQAESQTDNVVGDAFENMAETITARMNGEEVEGPDLEQYPVEDHDRSYYGDSLRVRNIDEPGTDNPNYMVYRDSLLLFSEEDSLNYTVEMAEDKRSAYISPAIPQEMLEGKEGIVFLKQDISEDTILLFDGFPEYTDEGMYCSLEDPETIEINRLFSDGKLEVRSKASASASLRSGAKGGKPPAPAIDFNSDIAGTNWGGEITEFTIVDVDGDFNFDIWDLEFNFEFDLSVRMDFEITTSGSSGGRETVKIASLDLNAGGFDAELDCYFEAEFDEHPIQVKGSLTSEYAYALGLTKAHFKTNECKVDISELKILNEEDCNEEINFYIGTQFVEDDGIGSVKINLIFKTIKIGPVLAIEGTTNAGAYLTATLEKDSFDRSDLSGDEIHICAEAGKEGCLSLYERMVHKEREDFKIDLFFDDWKIKLNSSGEKDIDSFETYNSYTFGTGFQDGSCPHRYYKVPVYVWENEEMETSVEGFDVTLADLSILDEEAKEFASSKTDADGLAEIFLPYKDAYQYTIKASGTHNGQQYEITELQPTEIVQGLNEQVNLFLKKDDPNILKKTISINWDIDLAETDRPYEVKVIVQQNDGLYWNTVKFGDEDTISLNLLNNYQQTVELPKTDEGGHEIQYRVRELSSGPFPKIIQDQIDKAGDYISSIRQTIGLGEAEYNSWRTTLKDTLGDAIWLLPDDTIDALNDPEGFTNLVKSLDTDAGGLYENLMMALGYLSSDAKIVYDKDDWDRISFLEFNKVVYSTDEVIWNPNPDDKTKYEVTYKDEGATCTITNKAILEVNIRKHWFGPGVDEKNMPDSAWVILMYEMPEGSEEAPVNFELPVVVSDLKSAGTDPLTLLGQLVLGINLNIIVKFLKAFGIYLPRLAIAKVSKENNWTAKFIVDKYVYGIPLEYKGAELGSEAIRQIIKYATGGKYDPPISYEPFGNYVSVPSKASKSYENWTNWLGTADDIYELLTSKQIGVEDLKNAVTSWTARGYTRWANVFNVKVDFDINWDWDPDEGVYKYKITKKWENDSEETRPEYLYLHLMDSAGREIHGSPVMLSKADFAGQNEWTYTLKQTEKPEIGCISYVTEEYPADYAYKDHYVLLADGKNLTNTWYDILPDTLSISGRKFWDDNNDLDGSRPETITVNLLADGTAVQSVETSAEGGWRYYFGDLPRYNEDGTEINYTLEEAGAEGYVSEKDGYNLINTHSVEMVTVKGHAIWEDNDNAERSRPYSITIRLIAEGRELDSKVVTDKDNWEYTFENLPKYKDGKYIVYSIIEDTVPLYDSRISGYDVINTYLHEETNERKIGVNIVWDDSNNADNIRPQNVSVRLLLVEGTGEKTEIKQVDVKSADDWKYTFEGLTKQYGSGETIPYILEVVPDDRMTGADGPGTYSWDMEGDMDQGFRIIAHHTDQPGTFYGTVKWEDDDDSAGQRPESVIIRLKKDGKEVENAVVSEQNGWTFRFDNISLNENGRLVHYSITEDPVNDYTTRISFDIFNSSYTVTNTYAPGKTSVSATLLWDDDNDRDGLRPDSIKVNLLANGKKIQDGTIDGLDFDQSILFDNLDRMKDGQPVVFTVEENSVPKGYTLEVTGDAETGFFLKNIHAPETRDIHVEKKWEDVDDAEGLRPSSIQVRLFANGEEVDSAEIHGYNWWNHHFIVPKYEKGKEIKYTLEESYVEYYTSSVKGNAKDGFVLTNTREPDLISVRVKKVWNDSGLIRPKWHPFLYLRANGKIVKEKRIDDLESQESEYVFENVPKYANGRPIEYTISETDIEDYAYEVTGNAEEGFTVTNTPNDGSRQIRVFKVWDDNDNAAGIRPESVTVHLYADGDEVAVADITAETNWTCIFKDLERYEHGSVDYTISEDPVEGYDTATISDSADNGFTITNTLGEETVSLFGTVAFDDNENQDGIRPSKVQIRLLANGKDAGYTTSPMYNSWDWRFSNLPKYENGKEIAYSVEEVKTSVLTGTNASGTYGIELSGDMEQGFTFTNIHTPEVLKIRASKVWDDNDNQDGMRPDFVNIRLVTDGVAGAWHKIGPEQNWEYVFDTSVQGGPLPRYDKGREIAYTVEEGQVELYSSKVKGSPTKGFVITNSASSSFTFIGGVINWVDGDDTDGIRPDMMTIRLLADGEEIDTARVTGNGNSWSFSFNNCPQRKDGEIINYTVEEVLTDVVVGVDSEVSYGVDISGNREQGFTITNTHTPETVTVKGRKIWDDNNDQYGARPEAVTVRLLANGKEIASQEVSEGTDWSWNFENLPKREKGAEIVYEISEDVIAGYIRGKNVVDDGSTEEPDDSIIDPDNRVGITNFYDPDEKQIQVRRIFEDGNNQDGIRPEAVNIKLFANGVEKASLALVDSDPSGIFTAPAKDDAGKDISYEIKVEKTGVITGTDGPGTYAYEVTGDYVSGFTVVCRHTPELISVSGSKTWNDDDDESGMRPDQITVRLKADGMEQDFRNVTSKKWTWSFDNLPKYKNGREILYTISEDAVKGYYSEINRFDITNTYSPGQTRFMVTQVWSDSNNEDGIRPEFVTVRLLADERFTGKTITLSENNNWTDTFGTLPLIRGGREINYELEVEPTDVLTGTDGPGTYKIDLDGSVENGFTIVSTHTPETITVSGQKIWNDNNNAEGKRPESVTVRLYRDGKEITSKKVSSSSDWAFTFGNLPKNHNGRSISYTVSEDAVEDYASEITGSAAGGFTITNTFAENKTQFTVNKIWDDADDQDGIRPDKIIAVLLVNGQTSSRRVELHDGNNWSAAFMNLNRTDEKGQPIEYGIEEELTRVITGKDGPGTYSALVSGNAAQGFTITNSHTPEKMSASGRKSWKDKNDEAGNRPDYITIDLYQDGDKADFREVTAEDDWEWTFNNLPKYRKGQLISYAIKERSIENYTYASTGLNHFNVENTYREGKRTVNVNAIWQDEKDLDGIRPGRAVIRLYANGVRTGRTVTLNNSNQWSAVFTNLDVKDGNQEIVYTVEEQKSDVLTGKDTETTYSMDVSGNADEGFTVVNSHTPRTFTTEAIVDWSDLDDQDGIRPESVTLKLLADGSIVQSEILSEENGWKWSITKLPKYKNGKEISYTLEEEKTDVLTGKDGAGTYEIKVDGNVEEGFVVTNTHTPETALLNGTVSWNDSNNQDGVRPGNVSLRIFADGVAAYTIPVSGSTDSWTFEVKDLPKYKAGKPVSYSIEEEKTDVLSGTDGPGTYAISAEGSAEKGFTFTNTHTPETVTVSGNKVWNDNNDADGNRPDSIRIHLMADGEEHAVYTVSAADEWKWDIKDLPKYKNGKEILYIVEEEPVEDYTSTVEGSTITNTYSPGKTQIRAYIIWSDNTDQDGIRPESATVKLFANGEDTGKTLTLSEANGWRGVFSDLNKRQGGKEIFYTVEEIKTSVITGQSGPGTYAVTTFGGVAIGACFVMNVHIPEKVDVSGSKTWEDKENQDGLRPESIMIRLKADGSEIDSKKVSAAESWKWNFNDLPKYNAGKEISYSISEDTVSEYSTSINGYDVTNSHTPAKTKVSVTKVWKDNEDQDGIRPAYVTVKLIADGKDIGRSLTLSKDHQWTDTFTDLNVYSSGKEINYTVEEVKTDVISGTDGAGTYATSLSGDIKKGFILTNTHTPEEVQVEASVVWNDAENQEGIRPEKAEISLLADGKEIRTSEISSNEKTVVFESLPKYMAGKEISYTAEEVLTDVLTGKDGAGTYAVSSEGTAAEGFTFTNTHTPEKTSLEGQVVWNDADDQDGIRPEEAVIRILADGQEVGTTKASGTAAAWKWEKADLPKYSAGKEIVYTAEEMKSGVLSGTDGPGTYAISADGSAAEGIVFTNTHTPETTVVSGSKTWDDNDDESGNRPDSIRIHLYANGIEQDAKTVTAEEGWKWSFKPLPKYEEGKEILYTVSEDDVRDYTSKITGFDIQNTYKPGKTQVFVGKIWSDVSNQDGIRPASVKVKLFANGEDTGKILTLSQANGWRSSFDDLEVRKDGKEIRYTVEEEKTSVITGQDGPGTYASFCLGEMSIGYFLINAHTPETADISGNVVFQDADDQDGIRPSFVKIRLLADGKETDVKTVKGDSTFRFEDLPKYKDGKIISYTVEEEKTDVINGTDGEGTYAVSVTGSAKDGFTVTDIHTPVTISVNGSKTWNDSDDQDAVRPESIVIRLKADGIDSGQKTVTAQDGWKWSFEDLPKYKDGKEIRYTITEDEVKGYTSEVTGFHITNTHQHEKVQINVSKVWNDADDQDGIRPEAVTVRLFADGSFTGRTLKLSGSNDWTSSFKNLNEKSGGKAIIYTVEEEKTDVITGTDGEGTYRVSVEGNAGEGFTLTNTHTPMTTKVQVSKVWIDSDNDAGARPESITIRLLADQGEMGSQTVTAADNWNCEFKDLPKYNHGKLINYQITEDSVPGYTSRIEANKVINTYCPGVTQVSVHAVWRDKDDQDRIRPASAAVKLLADGAETGKTAVLSAENGWKDVFEGLDAEKEGKKIVYTVEEESTGVITGTDGPGTYSFAVSGDMTKGFEILNEHTPETTFFEFTKNWNDNGDQDGMRPEGITARLYADGEEVGHRTIAASDNWKWNFTNLPKYRLGREIVYTTSEDSVENYDSVSEGAVFTNTHVPQKTQVLVSKVWKDQNDQDGIRPEGVTVWLLANGESTGKSTVLSEDNHWTAVFDDLDEYSEGKKISYSVEEQLNEVITGENTENTYAVEISGTAEDGFVITNTHTPAVTEVSGSKLWDDKNDQDGVRPNAINIRLYADGSETGSQTVTEADGWKWTFENLPKYKAGQKITYTVSEDDVKGYVSVPEDVNIINVHETEKTKVIFRMLWNDAENQDGIRPETVTVKLLADGADTGKTLTVSQENNWQGSFDTLEKRKEGKEIRYTVEAEATSVITGTDGPGTYASSYFDNRFIGYYILNTHTPEVTTVSGGKTWEDNSNQDGIRPESIVIRLKADGTEVTDQTVNQTDGWKWTFEDLPKYRAGKEIRYEISEDAVTGYTTEVSGFDITNTHVPEKVVVNGSKTWEDNNDQDGIRPESIVIRLKADGSYVAQKTVRASDGWEWSFEDLPEFKDGKAIRYEISEESVPGYTAKVIGFDVTNTHVPETVNISGSKTWEDNNDQDGIRPESIVIRLKADGSEVADQTVTQADGWKWTFEELPKYRAGKEICYEISEDAVPGYISEVRGFDVSNSHTPEMVTVSGSKTWSDNQNKDGVRPESIRIRLYADGVEQAAKTVSEADGWKWTFKDLPKYEGGKEILYTVSEDNVPDYTSKISGFNIQNTYTSGKTQVYVRKIWNDGGDQDGIRPASVRVKLSADGKDTGKTLVLSERNNWRGSFDNLEKRNDGKDILYTIVEEATTVITGEDGPGTYSADIFGNLVTGYFLLNTHTPETVTVSGSKIWDDNKDQDGMRPDSIVIRLNADGNELDARTVSETDGWKWIFEGLPKYKDGKEIRYEISEDTVPGYTAEVKGFNVTNTRAIDKMQVNVSKVWNDADDQDGIRPDSVTVRLLADGKESGRSLTLSEENGWAGTFTDLDAKSGGKAVVYSVAEELTEVISGADAEGTYAVSVAGSVETGFVLTNTHTPMTTVFRVSKIWNDENNNAGVRPESITVRLMAEGKEAGSKILTAEDNWSWTFRDLPRYDKGRTIDYYVTEDDVPDYAALIEGGNVTNTYRPGTTQVYVHTSWSDADDQDGIRPGSVTMKLLANGEETGKTLALSADNNWMGSFDDLDVSVDGAKVVYSVEEETTEVITGTDGAGTYGISLSGDMTKGFEILNVHTPETMAVDFVKNWEDQNDQDGIRPESITVRLYADESEAGSQEVTEADDWKWTFENLPKYNAGQEIRYTVTEDDVAGYASETAGYHITNIHETLKTALDIRVNWIDMDDQDGIRPESVTIKLLADGEETGKTLTLSDENQWQGSFDNLDRLKGGNMVKYTVEEVKTDVITGDPGDGTYKDFTIRILSTGVLLVNYHEPERVTVSGSKTWEDQNDLAGKRPESIVIHLMDGHSEIRSEVISAENGWSWSFEDLPKFRQGEEISYSIQEDAVSGYRTEIDGYNITNHYIEPEPEFFTITYKLNGGVYRGSSNDIVEEHLKGSTIKIHAAPEREGYTFLYWKGSEYYPGDPYTVTGDHTMTAQWEAVPGPGGKDDVPTGDSNKPLVWIVTMLSALLAVSVLATIYTGRRRRNDQANGRNHDQK